MADIVRDQDAAELGDLPIAVEVMGDPDVQGSTTSFCDRGRWMGQSLADAEWPTATRTGRCYRRDRRPRRDQQPDHHGAGLPLGHRRHRAAAVRRFGDRHAALVGIVRLLGDGNDLPTSGPFEVVRHIEGQSVHIRGAVVDGTPKIGTVFTP